ncbi:MAG: hypothetical protein VW270_14800 [Candidatus Poseidoniales archaeon]
MNYSKEETDRIIEEYTLDPTRDTVDRLAEETGRTSKSIIGKLSREGVYKKSEYLTKTGEKPVTKAELVERIRELLGLAEDSTQGLEKAPKETLKAISEVLILTLRPEEFNNENC